MYKKELNLRYTCLLNCVLHHSYTYIRTWKAVFPSEISPYVIAVPWNTLGAQQDWVRGILIKMSATHGNTCTCILALTVTSDCEPVSQQLDVTDRRPHSVGVKYVERWRTVRILTKHGFVSWYMHLISKLVAFLDLSRLIVR